MPSVVNVRNACITCNNPTSEASEVLSRAEAAPVCTFLVFQKEVGASGTPHYQAYAEFSRAVRFAYINRIFGSSCHVEPRSGPQDRAIAYCEKEEGHLDGPWRYGDPKSGASGSRTDLTTFKDAVKAGTPLIDLIESHTSVLARYPRFYDFLRVHFNRVPRDSFEVRLLFGPPGTGKTEYVYNSVEFDHLYTTPVMGSGFWLDQYAGERHALLDDFGGGLSGVSRTNLLRLTHKFPVKAPVKGGFTLWNPEIIWITTNLKPQEWYDWSNRVHWAALVRRITYVQIHAKDLEPHQLMPGTRAFAEFFSFPTAVSPSISTLPYNNL